MAEFSALGTASLGTEVDLSGLTSGLQKGEGEVKGWGDRAGGVLKNAFSFVTGGLIMKGIDTITSSIGGLVSGMIGGNAAFEGYNTRFETMLGSAALAKERMADLAEFGAKTPFELPQVVEADTVLQGFGLHSEEAAKKFGYSGAQIRTIAGDVASGTGSDFKEMSLLIGKFSSGATGEAISRMQELGITNRDELTKMGLEFSKSGELLSPLPESMNTILGLMQDKYGGLMDAQSSTFEGMKSNLQDWVAGTLRTIGAPIFDVLKVQLGNLLGFLNDPGTMAALDSFATSLASGIGAAMTWLTGTVIPGMVSAWQTISPVLTLVGGIIADVGRYLASVVLSGDPLNDWLTGLPGPIQVVAAVLGTFIANIQTWATAIGTAIGQLMSGDVSGAFATLGTAFQEVIGNIGNLGSFIGPKLLEIGLGIATQVLAWGQSFASWVAPYIPIVLGKLAEFAGVAWGWITEQAPILLSKLAEWGTAFVNWIGPMIPPLLEKAGELAASLWGWIVKQTPKLVAQLLAWGEKFVAWIGPQIPILLAKAGELASKFITWISAQATPILAKLKIWADKLVEWIVPATKEFLAKWPVFFDQFLTWVGNAAGPLLAKLATWATSLIAWVLPMIPPFLLAVGGIAAALLVWVAETAVVLLKKIVTEWVPAIINWIANDAIPKLLPALAGILTTIGGWITTAAAWVATEVKSIGTSLVAGIRAGVESAWDSFMRWIDEQIAKIPKAIRDFFGIGSPSKLMADQVGKWIPAGIAVGLDANMGAVDDALARMNAAVDAGLSAPSVMTQPLHLPPMPRLTPIGGMNQERFINRPLKNDTTNTTNQYNLSAQYRTVESESSIMDDLRKLELLHSTL